MTKIVKIIWLENRLRNMLMSANSQKKIFWKKLLNGSLSNEYWYFKINSKKINYLT